MPTHDVSTVNPGRRPRRWTYAYPITLSDTVADKNLQRDSRPYKFVQNTGTSGIVRIYQDNGTTVDIYLSTGQDFEGGYWQHAQTTGTTAGVTLVGFVGVEGLGG
jgi:hypothetical protein